jgi:hypothetical protein
VTTAQYGERRRLPVAASAGNLQQNPPALVVAAQRPVSPAPERTGSAPAPVKYRRRSSRHPFARPATYHIRNCYYFVNSNVATGSPTSGIPTSGRMFISKGIIVSDASSDQTIEMPLDRERRFC